MGAHKIGHVSWSDAIDGGYMDVVGNGKASAGGKMPVAETSFNGFGSGFSDSDDDLEI